MAFFDDFNLEDAAWLGALFGMAEASQRGGASFPDDAADQDSCSFDTDDPGPSLEQIRRNDPELFETVLNLVREQKSRRQGRNETDEELETEGVNQGLPRHFFAPRYRGGLSDQDFYDYPDLHLFDNSSPGEDIRLSYLDDAGKYFPDVVFRIQQCIKTGGIVCIQAVEKRSGGLMRLRVDRIYEIEGRKPSSPVPYPVEKPITPRYRLRKTPLFISYGEPWLKAFGLGAEGILLKPVQNQYEGLDDGLIKDMATGLMWKVNENPPMGLDRAKWEISRLKNITPGGFENWRLPTVDELLSLSESKPQQNGWCIDPGFNLPVPVAWSADFSPADKGHWAVTFEYGGPLWVLPLPAALGPFGASLLAVRSCNVTPT